MIFECLVKSLEEGQLFFAERCGFFSDQTRDLAEIVLKCKATEEKFVTRWKGGILHPTVVHPTLAASIKQLT